MPTYDFECQNKECSNTFDRYCPIDEIDDFSEDLRCPLCDGKVARLISGGIMFVIKGASSRINIPRSDAEDWKINRHIKEVAALQHEPMSETESAEAWSQGKAREKDRGLKDGHVSGGREPLVKRGESQNDPKVKKKISKFKETAQKQIAKSQDDRKKVV